MVRKEECRRGPAMNYEKAVALMAKVSNDQRKMHDTI
jgi:hypothetical protein